MNIRSKQRNGTSRLALVGTFALLLALAQASLGQNNNANPGNNGQAQNPNQEILDRLNDLEAKLDDLAGPQATATFCISQGREIGLSADWIMQIDMEFEAGVGWAEVFSGEATAEAKIPAGPIPSETTIGVGGSHGRGLDVCIDLPIQLGPTDTALLAELAQDINAKANDFPNRGKFQRRTHRLLNFTKRRVPGVQMRTDADPVYASLAMAQATEEAADDEFDLGDAAIDNLFANGLRGSGGNFAVLRNTDIKNLVSSFDGIPSDITAMVNDPEQILNPLSDAVNGGIDKMDCSTFGIDTDLRNQKSGLNKLCNRLEGFPSFERVENVLSGELIADLYEALDSLTVGDNAAEVSEAARKRFCDSKIGQLLKYNVFCKR